MTSGLCRIFSLAIPQVIVSAGLALLPVSATALASADSTAITADAAVTTSDMVLTAAERAWIAAHPRIVFAVDGSWEPIVLKNPDGSYSGIDLDFVDRLNKLLGTRIVIETGNWSELVEKLKHRQIDGLTSSSVQDERRAYANFTAPYVSFQKFIYLKDAAGSRKFTAADLAGKHITFQAGNLFEKNSLEAYAGVVAMGKTTRDEQIAAVLAGEADGFVGDFAFDYWLTKQGIRYFEPVVALREPINLVYSIREDWPELAVIIDKGLRRISADERMHIVDRYLREEPRKISVMDDFALSDAEAVWLQGRHRVRVRIGDQPPYMFKQPVPSGLAVDYLDAVAKRFGFTVDYVNDILDWPTAMQDINGPRQSYDMLLSMSSTPEREREFALTNAFHAVPWVIYTRKDSPFISGLESLRGKTLAQEKGFIIVDRIRADFPGIQLLEVASSEDALRAVATGRADGYVGNLGVASFLIKRDGFANLVVAAPAPFGDNQQAMAVRKDWPELVSLINKGISAMPADQRNQLAEKWMAVEARPLVDYTLVWQVLIAATLLVLVFVYWNRKLAREIIHRQRIASDLQTEKERAQRYLDTAQTIMVALDVKGTVTMINRAGCRLLGYTEGELLGRNWFATCLPQPEGMETAYPMFQQIISGEIPGMDYFENRIRLKNGDIRLCAWHNAFFRDRADAVVGILSSGEDITERKQAEERLRESEEKLRGLYELSPLGIALTDMRGKYLDFNESFAKIGGYPASELRALDNWALTPPEYAEQEAAQLASLSASGRYGPCEKEYLRKDGSRVSIRLNGVLVTGHDGQRCIWSLVEDITRQKCHEAELQQAKESAERANRAKSEFLSRMSHELRTPMNAILGFSQLLKYDPSLQVQQQENIDEILKAGFHLLDLINEVLDLARIESGRMTLNLEPIEITMLLQECVGLTQPLASQRWVSLQEATVANEYLVLADQVRLRQVLLNLLANAIKYNREGGTVKLEITARDQVLRINVIDTGMGIEADELDQIFQPFNRLGVRTVEIEGTGIGLSISRSLVELMGGRIGVESQPGVGSSFWIELPITTSAAALPMVAPVGGVEDLAIHDEGKWTVLYIEDNPANLKLVQSILSLHRPQIRLLTADLPAPGLALARHSRPDLILLDINLPEMDGYQVLARLRSEPMLRQVPVIAVTARAMPQDIERGREASFSAYLTKPLEISSFLQALDHCLGTLASQRVSVVEH